MLAMVVVILVLIQNIYLTIPSVATGKGGGGGGSYTAGGNAGGSAGGGGGVDQNYMAGVANQPSETHPLGGTYTNYGNNSGSHPGPNTGISAGGGGGGCWSKFPSWWWTRW